MADIKIGGSSGEDGLTYVGVIDEIWVSKDNKIRRSNGQTPGGVVISSAGGGGATAWADITDINNANGP